MSFSDSKSPRWRAATRPLFLFAGLVAAGLLVRLLPHGGAIGLLARDAGDTAATHAVELVLLGGLLCAVGLPRQLVCYACGAAFGASTGLLLAMAAQLLGCAADVTCARVLARRWVERHMGGRLARLDARLAAHPFAATLSLRLLPVGSNLLLNLAAGLSSVAVAPFLAASVLGYLPQTVIFTLAGGGVSIGHGEQVAMAAALLLASAGLGTLLLRRPAGRAASAGSS